MYDIYFDARHAVWRIRIVTLTALLFTSSEVVCDPEAADGSLGQPMGFESFTAAEAYVERVGINRAYTRRFPREHVTLSEAVRAA
jgi:hypothetical protein